MKKTMNLTNLYIDIMGMTDRLGYVSSLICDLPIAPANTYRLGTNGTKYKRRFRFLN